MSTESDPALGQLVLNPTGPITVFLPEHETFLLDVEGLPSFDTDDLRALFAALATWPPLSREQVVELHEALVAFQREMNEDEALYKGDGDRRDLNDAQASTARGLRMVLWSLNIGTPQPPLRQEANLGDVACLDERRMGPPPPLGAYTGPPAEMVPIPAYSGSEPVVVPLAYEAVKHNCWTCGNDRNPAPGSQGRHWCESPQSIPLRAAWAHQNASNAQGMPPKDSDGCPGWEQK